MVSSGTLRHVALVRTDVSEGPGASFIRVTRIGELEDTILHSHRRESLKSYIMINLFLIQYTSIIETKIHPLNQLVF
jgi:hypothetical protein